MWRIVGAQCQDGVSGVNGKVEGVSIVCFRSLDR